ncbi:hypothetical protein ACE1ET_05465 [Saccharicrinis sp. FJH62]|uniref:hypothetical protein n=1 Tax=Saccharicrinis sp. FJH62 TaxID=3344657 RepID=UPI0035D4D30B
MRKLLFLILFIINILILKSQTPLVRNFGYSASIGIADLNLTKFDTQQDLDFMNYLAVYPDEFDWITVKLGIKFDVGEHVSTDLKLLMLDDFFDLGYDAVIKYELNSFFRLGIGSMLIHHYISGFEDFHYYHDPEYIMLDKNYRQFAANDMGIYLRPELNLNVIPGLNLDLYCNIGYSTFLKQDAEFYLKRKLSNEKILYTYETEPTYNPFIKPGIEIKLDLFSIKNQKVGLFCHSAYSLGQKQINYTRSKMVWTYENKVTDRIISPKHDYARLDVDFGVYVR